MQGILRVNHITDNILSDVVADVVVVKPAWYFENWAPCVATLATTTPMVESIFSPADPKLPMVSGAFNPLLVTASILTPSRLVL